MHDDIIVQVSIDVEGNIDLDKLQAVLRKEGIKVAGLSWKATWKARDYWEGKPPISSD